MPQGEQQSNPNNMNRHLQGSLNQFAGQSQGQGQGQGASSSNQQPGSSQQQQPSHYGNTDIHKEISSIDSQQRSIRERQKQFRNIRLADEEYEFIAADIMAKPPMSGYLKYHLPLKFAARAEEVRWVWADSSGRLVYKELIGGGRNSDLEYD